MQRYQMRVELAVEVEAFTQEDAEELVQEWFSEGPLIGNEDIYVLNGDAFKAEKLR